MSQKFLQAQFFPATVNGTLCLTTLFHHQGLLDHCDVVTELDIDPTALYK